jgi:hypothetical protein
MKSMKTVTMLLIIVMFLMSFTGCENQLSKPQIEYVDRIVEVEKIITICGRCENPLNACSCTPEYIIRDSNPLGLNFFTSDFIVEHFSTPTTEAFTFTNIVIYATYQNSNDPFQYIINFWNCETNQWEYFGESSARQFCSSWIIPTWYSDPALTKEGLYMCDGAVTFSVNSFGEVNFISCRFSNFLPLETYIANL